MTFGRWKTWTIHQSWEAEIHSSLQGISLTTTLWAVSGFVNFLGDPAIHSGFYKLLTTTHSGVQAKTDGEGVLGFPRGRSQVKDSNATSS